MNNDAVTLLNTGNFHLTPADKMQNLENFNIEKRSKQRVATSLNKKTLDEDRQAWDEKKESFANILKKIIPVATKIPVVGSVIEVFNSWIEKAAPEVSVWDQVKSQVNYAIQTHLKDNHFERLVADWATLRDYTKKTHNLTKEELNHIIRLKSRFFPQNFITLAFAPAEFSSAIILYFTYLNTALLDLMEKKVVTEEAYIRQLQRFKEEVIEAAKALHRKRYEETKGTTYSSGTKSTLTFVDTFKNKSYTAVLHNVESEIFDEIKKDTSDILMSAMVDKVNAFFNRTLCGENCPENITREDIDFEYSYGCFGDIITSRNFEKFRSCSLPCDSYGYDYDWCVFFQSHGGDKLYNHIFVSANAEVNQWRKCNRIDWRRNYEKSRCMPLKKVNDETDKKRKDKQVKRKIKKKTNI